MDNLFKVETYYFKIWKQTFFLETIFFEFQIRDGLYFYSKILHTKIYYPWTHCKNSFGINSNYLSL